MAPERIHVYEHPPRYATVLLGPEGDQVRVAGDEADRPLTNLNYSSTMPGGFAMNDVEVGSDRIRVPKFTPITISGAGGRVLHQARLQAEPERSEDGTVRLAGVGLDAALADAVGIRFLGCVSDLTLWDQPDSEREDELGDKAVEGDRVSLNTSFSVSVNPGGIRIAMDGDRTIDGNHTGEVWFLQCPPGQAIDEVQYIASQIAPANMDPRLWASDSLAFVSEDHAVTADLSVVRQALATPRHYVMFRDKPAGGGGSTVNKPVRTLRMHRVTLFADHGLKRYSIAGGSLPDGLLFSDVLAHLIEQFTPLRTSRYGRSTIVPSTMAMPDLAWLDPTDLATIVGEGVEMEPDRREWAVWEGGTTDYGPRNDMGRVWTVRRQYGAQLDELDQGGGAEYNVVLVAYEDSDGRRKIAGPPGFNADVEDAVLRDTSSDNPVNASPVVGDRPYLVELPESVDDATALEYGELAMEDVRRARYEGKAQLGEVAELNGERRSTMEIRSDDWIRDGDRGGPDLPLVEAAYKQSEAKPVEVTVDRRANTLDAIIAGHGMRPSPLNRRRIEKRLRQINKRLRRRRRQMEQSQAERRA